MNPPFPTSFVQRLAEEIGENFQDILNALDLEPINAIRWNDKLPAANITEEVPWCSNATYLNTRWNYAQDPLFHAGAYYPQEPSSMSLEVVFRNITNLGKINRVLDLCAAPGGKSTHLSNLLDDSAFLVSNEIVPKRYAVLNENVQKWGKKNVLTTNYRPDVLAQLGAIFDVILCDAPCSGEGLFRKQKKWRNGWTEKNCAICASRQEQILNRAEQLLRPGGFLIYSTCTFNFAENIDQLNYLNQNFNYSSVEIPTLPIFGFDEIEKKGNIGYAALPHKVKGEPFFIACMQKPGNRQVIMARTSQILYPTEFNDEFTNTPMPYSSSDNKLYDFTGSIIEFLEHCKIHKLRAQSFPIAIKKNSKLIPQHFAAMTYKNLPGFPSINLDKEEALKYLRHEQINTEPEQKGYHVVRHNKINLGWLNFDGRRTINKYPMNWRLRK